MTALFWASALLLAYTYVGYPALIGLWARLRPRPVRSGRHEPALSVVVIAHDEAARIERRIENLLGLDYPRDRLEIVIASDGSRDDTVARARHFEPAGVRVVELAERRGKAAALNEVVPRAHGDVVVLADARQEFDARALRALVAPFADASVGAVSGELFLVGADDGFGHVGEGVGFYWRYEKFIRSSESLVDSTIGATGAIYAIRRELYEPIPEDTLLDDVLIPVRIARRGYRILYERGAHAFDRVAETAEQEATRKIRTIGGNFQLFAREPWLLHPRRNRLWVQALSHKLLRLLSPALLAGCLAANVFLLHRAPYRWTLVAQAAFYAAALGGWATRNARVKSSTLSVPYVFCLLNWVTVVAFVRYLGGLQRVTWEKGTYRPS